MSDGLLEKCRDWLLKEGYPLEFEAARAWSRNGFRVRQSLYYNDPETGVPRELDVLAYYHYTAVDNASAASFTVALTFLVECKSSQDPWIVLCGENSDRLPADVFTRSWLVVGDKADLVKDLLSSSWWMDAEICTALKRLGHGVVRAMKGTGTGTDPAYNAVRQVLSAARARADKISAADESRRCHIIFPVVVFSGRLFEAWMSSSGEVELEEVKRSFILLESESEKFGISPVVLVTEEGLWDFTAAASRMKKICRLGDTIANSQEPPGAR